MKTLQYMFDKALSIINNDDKAMVGFLCTNNEYKSLSITVGKGLTLSQTTKTMVGEGSGKVQVFDIVSTNLSDNLRGTDFSHIFITRPDLVDSGEYAIIKSRVRITNKLAEPSGIYTPYGVERIQDY